ncbi:PD-(D/E)XK nuclease superfamily protein [Vibrio cholerae]|nr:PD-(D/E)XK nuclease superfamily protein [Vibrio cholerae]
MDSLNSFRNVTERDIDLLLIEELQVSPSFANWFVYKALGEATTVKSLGVWHSVSDATLGESDLIFKFQSDNGVVEALLIENKIDADAQPEQGERYQLRGHKGKEQGYWEDFRTCILAPLAYLERNIEPYDCEIAYEDIIGYLKSKNSARSNYRANVLTSAVEKQRRGYVSCVSIAMTEYARKYLEYVSEYHPELRPEKSKPRAEGHTWINFYPFGVEKKMPIVHQIYGDAVKIMFLAQAERYEELSLIFNDFNAHPLVVRQSGKSVIVEVKVSSIDPIIETFEASFLAVQEAIKVALDLYAYCVEKRI